MVHSFDAAAIHEQLLFWYANAVAQHDRRVLAVIAIPAIAIEHDLLGAQADLEHVGEIILRVEPVKKVGARNVACPIMLIVAGIYEDDPILLAAWVAKQLRHLVAVSQLQAVFPQAGGEDLDG